MSPVELEDRQDFGTGDGSLVIGNGKQTNLADIHSQFDGTGGGDDDSWIVQLQDRLEDARDALMENEYFSKFHAAGNKVFDASSTLWAFSKRAAWIFGTSALVLVVPLLYEMDKEMNISNPVDANSAAVGQPTSSSDGPSAESISASKRS